MEKTVPLTHELDTTIPGNVYLCQGSRYSCGACCGLYNVPDPSYDVLAPLLKRRTKRFRELERPHTIGSLDRFRTETEAEEPQNRPYDDFHHCPYIGFIRFPEDPEGLERVGCLLHPLGEGNDGIDWRGLSDYGGLACRTYFCPTCARLPERYKQLMRMAADDWYLYGLMTTETELADTFFRCAEKALGKPLNPDECPPEALSAIRDFFRLKADWPWRDPADKRIGNYFFNDNLYPVPEPALPETVTDPEIRFLLKSLRTAVSGLSNQQAAVTRIRKAVQAVADAFTVHSAG